jgi:hypothetical protein
VLAASVGGLLHFWRQRNGPSSGGKLRPPWGLMPGAARLDYDLGLRSAAAISFCVKVACFEITSGLFRLAVLGIIWQWPVLLCGIDSLF